MISVTSVGLSSYPSQILHKFGFLLRNFKGCFIIGKFHILWLVFRFLTLYNQITHSLEFVSICDVTESACAGSCCECFSFSITKLILFPGVKIHGRLRPFVISLFTLGLQFEHLQAVPPSCVNIGWI